MGPKPPAYRVMNLQTKWIEQLKPLILSDKENGNCICQNGQNLLYWNRYFVMYPHKCTLKKFKKKYQEKWENTYLIVKNARASRALWRALDPGQYYTTRFTRSLNFAWLRRQNLGKNFWAPPLDQILDPLLACVNLTDGTRYNASQQM